MPERLMSRLFFFLLVISCSTPSFLFAQDSLQATPRRPVAFRQPLTTTVQRAIDVNNDSLITALEIAGAYDALIKLDKDNSGDLNLREIGGPGPITGMLRYQPLIRVLDKDGDLKFSAFEIEHASRSIKRLDRDNDGNVDKHELSFEKSIDPGFDEIPRRTRILLGDYANQIVGSIKPGANPGVADGFLLLHETSNYNDVQIGRHTYLLNQAGQIVQGWFNPRLSSAFSKAKLLENGLLWRTVTDSDWLHRENYPLGAHGIIELVDFNGNVLWSYKLDKLGSYVMHHDFEPLPNGNILITAYTAFSHEEAAELGFDTSLVDSDIVWFDSIIELSPDFGSQSAELVWQWNSWEHIVQDKRSQTPSYGKVAKKTDRIDINAIDLKKVPYNSGEVHQINSISYHPGLDVILASSATTGEIWVIDHSTTIKQAASDEGGNYGKGGRLLYRWGNPQMIGQSDQPRKLFWQTDAKWVNPDLTDNLDVLIYNTGLQRDYFGQYKQDQPMLGLGEAYTDLLEITLPPLTTETDPPYYTTDTEPETKWTWNSDASEDFYSPFGGGVNRLPNGNTIFVEAHLKHIIEVTPDGKRVLDFLIPGPGQIFSIDRVTSVDPEVLGN